MLVVDLRTGAMVDFAGLGALLELRRRLGVAGRLYLLGPSERLRGILARAQIDTVFTLVSDEDALGPI